MQVGDLKTCKAFSEYNPCKTLTPITRLLEIFSLSYNVRQGDKKRSANSCWRLILSGAFFGSLSVFVLYYKICCINGQINHSVLLMDYIQSIFDYCQYVVDLFYVHYFGRRYFNEYFLQYKAIDQIIGTGSCISVKSRLIKLVAFSIIMWLITATLDFATWASCYGWVIPSLYSIAYLYFFLKILNNLDLTSQTMHIEVRLRLIGDLVQSYYSTTEAQPGLSWDSLGNNTWFNPSNKMRFKEREALKNFASNKCHEITWLSRCYLLLTEQCAFVNQMFGIRILLNSLSLLIDMVKFSNLAIRILTGSQKIFHPQGYYYFPVISTTARLLMCMLVLISLVSHCQRVYKQTNRIINIIDHLLLNKKPDPEMREAIIELRDLVQRQPINFHLANFMRLDYSMLLSTASVVVTYTIIFLQST